jgi:putative ABC transport system substrate-binding protein
VQRLGKLGWIDGQTVAIEYRWADGDTKRFAKLAADFVRLKVDVIATWGTETAVAAKQATSVIPIVFTVVGDPVGSGLVASLARPGGNVTGLSTQHDDSAGKRLELLHEVVPNARRLAIMGNTGNSGTALEMRAVQAAAPTLGLDVITVEIRRSEDIAPGIEALKGRVEALYVAGDAFVNTNRNRINGLALAARLPTMHGFREIVEAGGLMSYAPNYLELFRRAADYVNKILRGAKPSDIPVEQPTKFDFTINLTTAKALGLTVPPTLLALADEVIE